MITASQFIKLNREKLRTIEDLAERIELRAQAQPTFALLLGAGASVTSGVRTGNDLVEEWRESLYRKLSKNTGKYSAEAAIKWFEDNESKWYRKEKEYSSFFSKKFDLQPHRRTFIEEQVINAFPSIGYAYLANLVKHKYFSTIFTTNFDDLLSESFVQFSDERPITCAHDSSVAGIAINSMRPKIIKLHGDYLYEDLKITTEQTKDLTVNMRQKLRQFLTIYGLVVTGYSGTDDSIMVVLNELIKNQDYLKNGVYWCLRENSKICENLKNFLQNERVFIVLIDGFDELFADLFSFIRKNDELPFSNEYISRRSQKVSKEWLMNPLLVNSRSAVICEHLNRIKKENSGTQFALTLKDYISKDNENNKDSLNDDEATKLLDLQIFIEKNKYEEVISKVNSYIDGSSNTDYKKMALTHKYVAYKSLMMFSEAGTVCDELIRIDEFNPMFKKMKAEVANQVDEKLNLLNLSLADDSCYWPSYYSIGNIYKGMLKFGIESKDVNAFEEAIKNYRKAIDVNPSISNPSWEKLFKLIVNEMKDKDQRNKILNEIINEHAKQDNYSPAMCSLILKFCKSNESSDFCGKSIFKILDESIKRYYPKNDQKFFKIIVEASEQFKSHDFALKYINHFDSVRSLHAKAIVALYKSRIFFNFQKDIQKAISFLEAKLSVTDDAIIAIELIELYKYSGDIGSARSLFERFKAEYDFENRVEEESNLLTHEGKFSEAILCIETLSNVSYFKQKHTITVVFIHLKAGNYERAREIASKFFEEINWNYHNFHALLLNYEFAHMKSRDKGRKNQRLAQVAAETKDEATRAVASLMLGNEAEALKLLIDEVERNYRNIYVFNSWPILESVIARLNNHFNAQSLTRLVAV